MRSCFIAAASSEVMDCRLLYQVGMTFVTDHSGRLFTASKCSLKDLVQNEVVAWKSMTVVVFRHCF